ncbi:hypothetical protein CEP53_010771 [Fusarium sp. AF-6]|nr:hypothetical protein CEP53_010771 [Fusarium sp. AF-6]
MDTETGTPYFLSDTPSKRPSEPPTTIQAKADDSREEDIPRRTSRSTLRTPYPASRLPVAAVEKTKKDFDHAGQVFADNKGWRCCDRTALRDWEKLPPPATNVTESFTHALTAAAG